MKTIAVSNLPYIKKNLLLMKNLLDEIKLKDVEIFLEPLDIEYHKQSLELLEYLKSGGYDISIHCPFRMVNLVSNDDSKMWKDTLWSFKESIDIASKYNAEFIVLHSNEVIKNKNLDKEISKKHLKEIVEYAISKNVVPVIENVGVGVSNLFNQDEFIELCNEFKECKVLIDIGHAIINKWDLEVVLSTFKNRLIAYHIHNNDGNADLHLPIGEGILDYNEFFKLVDRYTPNSKIVLEYGIDLENNIFEDIVSI